jgi:hypothetical protein
MHGDNIYLFFSGSAKNSCHFGKIFDSESRKIIRLKGLLSCSSRPKSLSSFHNIYVSRYVLNLIYRELFLHLLESNATL